MLKSKILIIDDEIEFSSTLCQRFTLRGITATDANNGIDGLERMKETNPDIIILDLKMPDMSGLDVLEKIKAYNPAIEVIMLTGHGSAGSGVEAKEKGAFDYIMKPIDMMELMDILKLASEEIEKA